MTEAVGFIIAAYTIPQNLPTIFVTDSNNARTLQRNIKNINQFTHWKKVRHIKQGIDYSIANHMEYLTRKWPKTKQLDDQCQRLYESGKVKCQEWARQQNIAIARLVQSRHPTNMQQIRMEDHDSNDESQSSQESEEEARTQDGSYKGHRYRFDESMLDITEHIIIIKVYSHQLDKHYNPKIPGQIPRPNLFITSANQFADNAAAQARDIIDEVPFIFDIFYPPFSPRWCFTIEGRVTNKGATKILYQKMDEELCVQLQHREKQGIMCRMLTFNE
jgi:hypothetical protein